MKLLTGLLTTWRQRADYVRRYGNAESAARTWELAAGDLEQALRELGDEWLTLEQAAKGSGYSERQLRR